MKLRKDKHFEEKKCNLGKILKKGRDEIYVAKIWG